MAELVGSGVKAPRVATNRIARYAYIAGGSFLVGIGILGIFLPLLPSTIFFLLAAGCYSRSSPSAHHWLTTNRYFGSSLRNYHEHRGATMRAKVTSIGALWLGIGLAIYLLWPMLWIESVLLLIAILVSAHLVRLRTISASTGDPGHR